MFEVEGHRMSGEMSGGDPKCRIADTLRFTRDRLESFDSLSVPDQEQCIVGCNIRLAVYLGEKITDCARACIERCMAILDAIACVLISVKNCETTGTQCLIDDLVTCKKRLDSAYASCLERCMTDCLSLKKTIKYPNEPYLPQATSVTVTCSAQCSNPPVGDEEACGLFFHLWPFGGFDQVSPSAEKPDWLLPRFSDPGNLYLGFNALLPPQTLTLLFQMTAGGGDDAVNLPPVAWEYLSNNQWHPVKILADQTNGLQNSGIISLDLPAYDPANNTVLSLDHQWLRASVAEMPDRFPKTAGSIRTLCSLPGSGMKAAAQTWRSRYRHSRSPLPSKVYLLSPALFSRWSRLADGLRKRTVLLRFASASACVTRNARSSTGTMNAWCWSDSRQFGKHRRCPLAIFDEETFR